MSKKTWILASAVALMAGISAQAAELPLLVKTNSTGYTAPEWARFEKCEVYANRVVISRQYGSSIPSTFKTVEIRSVLVSGGIQAAILAASGEKVDSHPNGLCDGPSTQVSAQKSATESVMLYSTGGCGHDRQERQGPASGALMDLVNQYCPLTHISLRN